MPSGQCLLGLRNGKPKFGNGSGEVYAKELHILNRAKTPPFYIEEGIKVDENVRLKYRYLDLRRPTCREELLPAIGPPRWCDFLSRRVH